MSNGKEDILLFATFFVIASECNERGNRQAKNPERAFNTVDCFGCRLAMTDSYKLANTTANALLRLQRVWVQKLSLLQPIMSDSKSY